ncbi:MAG: ABC transporter ATP-binding protein [Planctomycetota bacterium]|nr:ABC transporter ATP-binding protein [Planctomycetota bacterium]MCX8039193.1 ABC transporter ATP-binding protein [Planctomycetota bacterium]MDW8373607.1 ABC transporter ATP-binding protein [Planctomycetota bacterium]
MAEPLLVARGLVREYRVGGHRVRALAGVDLELRAGTCTAILGPSGSGKSTLLGCLALLDRPDAGSVVLDGIDTARCTAAQRRQLQRRCIGMVFQQFHLLPHLSALENALLPTVFHRAARAGAEQRARQLLARCGLGERLHHRPAQLSGGEQQRVAIARAVIHGPRILLADEPTANLDSATGRQLIELLRELAQEGLAVAFVTHDAALAAIADVRYTLRDGRIVDASPRA